MNYCVIRFRRRILFYWFLRSGNYISDWKFVKIKLIKNEEVFYFNPACCSICNV